MSIDDDDINMSLEEMISYYAAVAACGYGDHHILADIDVVTKFILTWNLMCFTEACDDITEYFSVSSRAQIKYSL